MKSPSDIVIVQADGTVPAESGLGYTLLANTTYYAVFGAGDNAVEGVQLLFGAPLIVTSAEVQDTLLSDTADLSVVAGEWVRQNPTGAYVAVDGAGMTPTLAVVAKTAGAIGAAIFYLGNRSPVRSRVKLVIGAAGGFARIGAR